MRYPFTHSLHCHPHRHVAGSKADKAAKADPLAEAHGRRTASLASLKLICDSAVFGPHLEALLAAQDARGNTPFMAAVACR